jgi:PAS domain S-box-containing protein
MNAMGRQMESRVNGAAGRGLDEASDAVVAVDAGQRVTYLNRAAEERYGATAAEMLGQPLSALYRERWLRPSDAHSAQATLEARGIWRGESVHVTRGGREVYVDSTVALMRGGQGEPRGSLSVVRLAGQRQGERHAAFLDGLRHLVHGQRAPQALVQAVLSALLEHLGLEGQAAMELPSASARSGRLLVHQTSVGVDLIADFLESLPGSPEGEDLVVDDVAADARTAARTSDFRRMGFASVLLVHAAEGAAPRARFGVAHAAPRTWHADELVLLKEVLARVTPAVERGVLEQTVRVQEERFRRLYEHAPTGIIFADLQRRLVHCNAAYASLLGYREAELFERPVCELVHPDDWPARLEMIAALHSGERPSVEVEARHLHRAGHPVWVHEFITVLRDERGAPEFCVTLVTDISARREAEASLRRARDELELRVLERTEELQQRADQLSRLASDLTLADQRARKQLAHVLHDHVQQLLASAKMNVEVLTRGAADFTATLERTRRCLEEAIAASRSLAVELSPPLLHEFGLAAGLEWLSEWMEEKHGLRVWLEADSTANPESEDVRTLVFESVRELLFNAVKHAQVKEAWVQLAVHDGTQCRVTVADRGKGFDPQARLGQKDLARVGLGLLTVSERLALLGGSMEVESAPGLGARYVLVAPRRRREGE